MRIQHNIMAMNAYRNLGTNQSALAKNLEKLSSGYRINRAGDDAAGLAISEKMRAQITGLDAAQKNVKDGISLVKTAEGATQEIHDMLNRMKYLATQSANGTYDNEVDRANLQKEVDSLLSEIDRIADSSNFNGQKLLDGSLATPAMEFSSSQGDWTDIAATGEVSVVTAADAANTNKHTMTVEYADEQGNLNKVEVEYTGDKNASKNRTNMVNALQGNEKLNSLFKIEATTSAVQFTAKNAGPNGAKVTSASTTDAKQVSMNDGKSGEMAKKKVAWGSAIATGDTLTVNGKTYEFTTDESTTLTDKNNIRILMGSTQGNTIANLNEALKEQGIKVTASNNDFTFEPLENGAGLKLQIGDTADTYNQLKVEVSDMHTKALGIGGLQISSQDAAAAAVDKIMNAINKVSSTRGDLGAIQNRLEHTTNNLGVMKENIQDAESSIRDTDVADEMMRYTKNNILIQASQAMLAQANQVPQGVLQLLQ